MSEYRIPTLFRIARTNAPALYEAEDARTKAVMKAAAEWSRVTGIGKTDGPELYRVALPQALFDTLEAFDSTSAMAAAMSWLIEAMEKDMRYGDESLVPRNEAGLAELSETLYSTARKWRNLVDEASAL
jgi:hypothetical protein